MTANEHFQSDLGSDNVRRASQGVRETTWRNINGEQDFGSPSTTQAPQTSISDHNGSSPLLSPQSIGALSFHTAYSSASYEDAENDYEEGSRLKDQSKTETELKKDEKKISANLNLSIDTCEGLTRGLSGTSRDTSASHSAKSALLRSPDSPRNRERGFSLRRSLLSRSVHGQTGTGDSVIELQPACSSASQTTTAPVTSAKQVDKKSAASVTISPVIGHMGDASDDSKLAKSKHVSSSLPHYETWVINKVSQSGILARFQVIKERIRKKILRIHEKPPSKDGRTGHEYISNTILSTRYSLYNFLPRQLFAQFSKLANFYFLCVSILQMIPGLSTTGTYTTIVPLLFFVTISMAKEGYDDLRRYRLDKAENSKTVSALDSQIEFRSEDPSEGDDPTITNDQTERWIEARWDSIRVGDVVKLGRDEAVPADMIILRATGAEDLAYIETMALDGETNLKSKQSPSLLAKTCRTTADLLRCRAHFVVEDPNLNLYNFEGRLNNGAETVPLTNNEVVYRGSIIRNTTEVIGMIIYTGEECKIRMNATKNPRIKAPALQSVVNKVVIILVIFVIVLAIFNTVAYQIWKEDVEEDSWYLANAGVAFFPILVSFIIIFNTMIPLSLYVSLEIVKLFQMLLMNDIEMYDEASNTPMEARTSTINEELGQVKYIFSDKTGTLTNNSMRFRKVSIAGIACLHDFDLQEDALVKTARRYPMRKKSSKGKKAIWRRSTHEGESTAPADTPSKSASPATSKASTAFHRTPSTNRHMPQEFKTKDLIKYTQSRPHTLLARRVRLFLLSLALCHTCSPEKKANGDIEYQAASPDEQALVRAAKELGHMVIDRQNATITLKNFPLESDGEPQFDVYQILDVLEFSSDRKRMSIIVRLPDHRICIFCKGADSILAQLLRQSDLALSKAIEVEQRANQRQSLEAQVAIRRQSETKSRKNSINRKSLSIHRPSLGGIPRSSMTNKRLQPIRDEVHGWLADRETDVKLPPSDSESISYSPRPSRQIHNSLDGGSSPQGEDMDELFEEAMGVDDTAVFERTFQHLNEFASEGLRTLLYGYRYVEESEYKAWKKIYLDASTSLIDRQERTEKAGALIERDLELAAATAIEDKLQEGVPSSIEKLRRANIRLWMLTGDKRETAINVGHSCRLIKDYSNITILDQELGDVGQCIAATILEISNGTVAHSVVVVDGHTLSQITASVPLRKLFFSLATQVDTVVCCRASPAQKASLVSAIRHKVKNAITLAIGDGANDIAMIQEAHVGIGITGKEGLQAARTSDYSIAQFRFLTKLLLVHGRWNYIRTCKYTLGTFWKEMLFYLTQALYQRFAGYTGTSLYESWSLSMFNTLFTSLPVIFMGIFEQDLKAATLLAVPELYHSLGHRNRGFNIKLYLAWVAMAASQAVVVFFIMLGLYGQSRFTLDNGLYAMGDLTFTACIVIIATKMQFWELRNKTYTSIVAMFLSIGGWFLWQVILASTYSNNVIYNVKDGFFDRFGRNPSWWLTLILIVAACWTIEIGVKTIKGSWFPSDADVFRELEKDPAIMKRFEQGAAVDINANAPYDDGLINGAGQNILGPVRTASEDKRRDDEVNEMLKRTRHSRATSGTSHEVEIESPVELRRRQHSNSEVQSPQDHKVSFAVADTVLGNEHDDDRDDDEDEDTNGKDKPRRKSTDVHELLKRGFGSVRKSLDTI